MESLIEKDQLDHRVDDTREEEGEKDEPQKMTPRVGNLKDGQEKSR